MSVTTITTKGQVVIPKAIRQHFNLRPSDRIKFVIDGHNIVLKPLKSVREMYGFVSSQQNHEEAEIDEIVAEAVVEEYLKDE